MGGRRRKAEKRIIADVDHHEVVHRRMAEEYERREREGLGTVAGRSLLTELDSNAEATRPVFALADRGRRREVRLGLNARGFWMEVVVCAREGVAGWWSVLASWGLLVGERMRGNSEGVFA